MAGDYRSEVPAMSQSAKAGDLAAACAVRRRAVGHVRRRGARLRHAGAGQRRGQPGLRDAPPGRRAPRLAAAGHRRAARRHPGRQPGRAGRRRRPVRRVRHAAGGLLRSPRTALRAVADSGGVHRFSSHRQCDELARNPFRVFTSMLATRDPRYFDAELRTRVEAFLAHRQLFDPALLAKARTIAADGYCDADAAHDFVAAAVAAFALSREPIDKAWYDELSRVSAVAADIAGVGSTHINHLTPRVLDIDDLYRRMTRARHHHDRCHPGPAPHRWARRAVASDLVSRSRRTAPVSLHGRHRRSRQHCGCGSARSRRAVSR